MSIAVSFTEPRAWRGVFCLQSPKTARLCETLRKALLFLLHKLTGASTLLQVAWFLMQVRIENLDWL